MFLLITEENKRFYACNYFNTSHVSINRGCAHIKNRFLFNFNTSHVSINLTPPFFFPTPYSNFNTSHVSINLLRTHHCSLCIS